MTQRLSLTRALVASLGLSGLGLAQDAPSFNNDIQPILDARCVVCHMTGAAQGELALEAGTSYQALVGVSSTQSKLLRVKPGDPTNSYLVHKLEGTQGEVGGSGTQMPQGTGALPQAQLDLILRWIEAGAHDN